MIVVDPVLGVSTPTVIVKRTSIAVESIPHFDDRMDVKTFMQKIGLIKVDPIIKESANGLPFITFENANRETLSIWFSAKQTALHSAGEEIVKGFFTDLSIMWTTNASGETRLKVASKGELKASLTVDDLF